MQSFAEQLAQRKIESISRRIQTKNRTRIEKPLSTTMYRLEPGDVLSDFNIRAEQYTHPKTRPEPYMAFEISDMSKLGQLGNNWNPEELSIIDFLTTTQPQNNKAEFFELAEQFFLAALEEGPLAKANPYQARLRRTVALICKTLRIPEQKVASGISKVVKFPIGVERSEISPFLEQLLADIGPVRNWSGNIPYKAFDTQESWERGEVVQKPEKLQAKIYHIAPDLKELSQHLFNITVDSSANQDANLESRNTHDLLRRALEAHIIENNENLREENNEYSLEKMENLYLGFSRLMGILTLPREKMFIRNLVVELATSTQQLVLDSKGKIKLPPEVKEHLIERAVYLIEEMKILVSYSQEVLNSKSESKKRNKLAEEIHFIETSAQTLEMEGEDFSFLPEINPETMTTEYLPNELRATSQRELCTIGLDLLSALTTTWKKLNTINTDIKPSNIRERSNGSLVIFDWGAKAASFDQTFSKSGINYTRRYGPPELYSDSNEVDSEKFIAFQLGALLLTLLFDYTTIEDVLTKEGGFPLLIEVAGKKQRTYTYNEKTVSALFATNKQKFRVQPEMKYLLMGLLTTNPAKRTSLKLAQQTLNELAGNRAT